METDHNAFLYRPCPHRHRGPAHPELRRAPPVLSLAAATGRRRPGLGQVPAAPFPPLARGKWFGCVSSRAAAARLTCENDASCDFDRRIHMESPHEAAISHVISISTGWRPEKPPSGRPRASQVVTATAVPAGRPLG